MPFVEDKNEQQEFARAIGNPEFDVEPEGSFKELLRAAYRTENSIGSFIAREQGLPDDVVNNESFNPWDHFTDEEKLDEVFVGSAALADTISEIDSVRRQQQRERSDRKRLSEAGADAFGAILIAGGIDPINYIPVGGTIYKTYRSGESILKSAYITAGVASASVAAQEGALHLTQMERTLGESAVNVSAATLLGGVLGGAPPLIRKTFKDNPALEKEIADSLNPEPVIARGDDSIGAMQVFDDVVVKGKVASKLVKLLSFDPLSRTITSQNKSTRSLAARLAESPIAFERGIGTAVETKAKIHDGKYYGALRGHLDAYKAYRKEGGALKRRQFSEAVAKEVRNPATDNVHIKQSADAWNKNLYEPLKNEFVAAKLLPEDVSVDTAIGYLNRVWNKQKIAANLDQFVKVVSKWLDEEQATKVRVQDLAVKQFEDVQARIKSRSTKIASSDTASVQVAKLEKQIFEVRRAQKANIDRLLGIKDATKRKELSVSITRSRNRINELEAQLSGQKDKARLLGEDIKKVEASLTKDISDLEKNIAEFPGKTADQLRSVIKSRDLDKIPTLTKTLVSAAKKIIQRDFEDFDSIDLAREIASRIRSTPDGRLPYDYQIGENSSKQIGKAALRGPLQKRSFNIPDKTIEEFLDNNIERIGGRYLRQTATDVELVKEFGDVNLTVEIKQIEEEWAKRIQSAKTPKERIKLDNQRKRDIGDIAGMRDRMRGTFGQVDPDNFWVRGGRLIRDLNYLRFMGGITASSLPDAARVIMTQGIVNTFKDGLIPLIKNTKAFKLSSEEAKRYGVGTDALLGGRAEILADVADYSRGGTVFERVIRSAASKFGKINLMDQWTGGIKSLHAVVMQTKVTNDLLKGKFDPRLEQLGINKDTSIAIAKQLKDHAENIDGVWVANTRKWDNQALADIWGGALRKESDRVIVMPGQEKPLFMSSELGKTIFQFMSFMFSATQRMMIAGIQGQDAHFMQGIVGLITIGSMSYAFKQWDAGREISDDPKVFIIEGIDRSGVLGILMEMNNTLEKTSSNNFGLRPLLGIDVPGARFASRSQAEALLGPTFGSFLETTLRVAGAASDEQEWKDSDTRALRRLLPYQNLMLFRQAIDKLEQQL